jgi:uncharacterized protein
MKTITIFARRPWISVVLLLLITSATVIAYYDPYLIIPRPSMDASEDTQAKGQNEKDRRPAPSVSPVRLFSSEVVIVAKSQDFFTSDGARALRAAVEELEKLPQVTDVMWFDRAPPLNIFGLREPALPDYRASAKRFADAKEKALSNPMIAGQLLSSDGQTALLLISLDWFYIRSDADCTSRLTETAKQAAAQFAGVDIQFAVTGALPIRLRMNTNTREKDRNFQWIAYGVVLTMAIILFRGPTAVFITAVAPALGIFWTLGCLRYFNIEENPFNTVVVPVLLSMVGFTDGVHMMTQIRKHRSEGMTGRDAAIRTLDEVGSACFLTSLTTAVGFGSLAFAHHQVVREFGWVCVLGVLLTFISVVTIIPLLCMTWLGKSVHYGHSTGAIEKNVHKIASVVDWVLLRPRLYAGIGIVATVVFAVFTLSLRPDERMLSAMPEQAEETAALRHMDRVFGGLETANVRVQWDSTIPDGSREIIEVSDAIERLLKQETLLGSPLGVATLIDALPGDGSAAQKASMVDLLPPPLKRAFLNPEGRSLSVIFRLQDIGIAKYGDVFSRITEKLSAIEQAHPGFKTSLDGNAVWRWRNLYRIVIDLTSSLGTAAFVIFVCLTVAYRSIRIGLISVIPNIFPLVITGAGMYFLSRPLELISVLAFTVCLGIAVDDTIHFLTRYTEELANTDSQDEAIRRAFVGVGSALIMTTVVLICGFATVLWSDTRDHHIFASMGSATIATALFADMLFLPALLRVFDTRSRRKHDPK